ncbi:MAG TPA: efflux RND transporter periplasmic adaptor subunit [Kofleriaceae bacterium]|nr:efflux RND transporter periplasmic adaptor subunit [Kofleriaceae bacterium]
MRALWLITLLCACHGDTRERVDEKAAPEPLSVGKTTQTDTPKSAGYIGVLTPKDVVEVTAPFTTNVKQFQVKLGEQVEKGTELALLDRQPLEEQLAVAKAELKGSEAEVGAAKTTAGAAAAALRREKAGQRAGIASKADVSNAAYKASEASSLVSKAVAAVEQQKARIKALESKLTQMTLTAPIAGRVSLRYVEPGGRVEEGKPIVRVISSDELFVKFAIPSEQAGRISPGDVVDVVIEGRDDKLAAKVKTVAPELDPVAQMIVAEAELTGTVPAKLQSGMVCRIVVADGAKHAN